MTMVAEPETAAAVARTLAELEAIIDAGLQTFFEVGNALAEIRERRLYRDQYETFDVYCRERFNFNRQRASQLIKAAAVSRILDKPPARASHAEALAPLVDQPEVARQVYAEVVADKGDKTTAADVIAAVEQVLPPSLNHAARSATRAAVDDSLRQPRPSVRTDREFSQDVPDQTYEFQPEADEFPEVNQEVYPSGRKALSQCSYCGDRYDGDACPCGGEPSATLTGRGDTAATGDDDAPIVEVADAAGTASALPAPTATPSRHPSQEQDRPLDDEPTRGNGGKKSSTVPSTRVFNERSLDAGDVARTLLDLPIQTVAEAIAENATPAQKAALRDALGTTAPTPPPAVAKADIREALGEDGCTVLELSKAIGETFTADARASLLALLADEMPDDRLGPLAHRLAVRVRNTLDDQGRLRAVKADAGALPSGLQRALASHLFDGMSDEDKRLFQARVNTALTSPSELAAARMGR